MTAKEMTVAPGPEDSGRDVEEGSDSPAPHPVTVLHVPDGAARIEEGSRGRRGCILLEAT